MTALKAAIAGIVAGALESGADSISVFGPVHAATSAHCERNGMRGSDAEFFASCMASNAVSEVIRQRCAARNARLGF